MKNKKIESILLLIVIFQIFLLINVSVAYSYIIHQSESLIENQIIKEKDESQNLINSGINLLIGFLSIKQIGIVSAQVSSPTSGCCMENCVDVEEDACEGNWVSTPCDSTTQCQLGTCIDYEEGICSAGAPHHICTEDGGEWKDLSIDKIDECKFGCCTLDGGASKQFLRRIKCIKEGGNFNPSVSEANCRIYTRDMGACLLDEGNCKFTTEEDCETNLNGGFRLGFLCSNPSLDTLCKKPETEQETKTKCYDDKVYFLDTCDNLANIYHSSKWDDEDYWERVQNPDCELDFGGDGFIERNSQETCGNCDGMNSICGSAIKEGVNPNYGDYVCKDLKCIDEEEIVRQNQESWCIYESHVGGSEEEGGYSTDVVGSEYRIRWCDKGEIKTDLCENWRGKICGEREISLENGDSFSMARCRFNEGWKCFQVEIEYELNDDGEIVNQDEIDESKEECESISDCRVQSIDLYDSSDNDFIIFDVCLPKYPPGLEFWESRGNAEDMCGLASVEVPTIWQKWLKWECKGNCEVLTQDFANQMNDFCISLGDCGGYVNVEEKYTKNFDTFNIKELSEDDYKIKSKYDADGDIDDDKKSEYRGYAEDNQMGLGDLPQFFSSTEQGTFGGDPFDEFDITELDWYTWVDIVAIGGLIGAGALIGLATLFEGLAFLGPYGWIAAAIIAVIYLLLKIFFGLGDTKEIEIEFVCEPWQAPIGGDDCEECDKDPLRPCTEYKCRSLGSGCRLIGEDELYESENPVCIYKYDKDTVPPIIIPKKIGEDYEFFDEEKNKKVKIRPVDGDECIQEFTPINFTLKTENENGEDDYAKCVYNWESVTLNAPEYELEGEKFKEGNFFSVNHTFEERLPFVSDLDSADITGDIPGERTGDLIMYIRCMDYAGNPNFNEYLVNICIKEGPDDTAARITEYNPKDESFLKYEDTNQSLTISLDEPAKCKWSHEADKSYNDIENNFTYCPTSGSTGSCITELTGLTQSENKVYIKCKDQPWLEGIPEGQGDPWDETNRNVNTNDFVYTLYATPTPLIITSISPQGEIIRGGDEYEVKLEVETSGGMENGISTCKYEFIESPTDSSSWDFFAQKDPFHTYTFNLISGDYNILVTCWDDAENKAQVNAIFNLMVDDVPPIIVRAYKDGSNLKLITNEQAKCYFDSNRCSFDLETGTSITTAFSTTHTTKWNPSITYHVKCKDLFDNTNSGCAKKIIPSS